MKITFVHFGREHLGIEYLSAVLKMNNHETTLACDPGTFSCEDNVFYIPFLEKLFNKKQTVIRTILDSKPELLVFSVYTSTYKWALDIAKVIKEQMNINTVFGGIHVTLKPEEVIANDLVDFIVIGEGEYALLDLIEAIKTKKNEFSIQNVWYKKDGVIKKNPIRKAIDDLNSLPLPDKELFKKHVKFKDDYVLLTARGCFFNCNYCCESFLNNLYCNKYFRRRSVDSVMKELTFMKKKYNFSRVMCFDSILFTDKPWLMEFLKRFKKEINVPFRCTGHVNFVDRDIIFAMKEAGCYCIDFGVQTFNEKIRANLLNRKETNKDIEKAFNLCDEAKLRYDVDLILGLPLMTVEDYKLPIKIMNRHKYFNRLKCYNLTYYPSLKLQEKAKELGVITEMDIVQTNKGDIGDWFHIDKIKDKGQKKLKITFEKIYKLYPILPKYMRRDIVNNNSFEIFYYIPNFIIIMFQLLIGFIKKDHRFYIYIKYYFWVFKKSLFSSTNIIKKVRTKNEDL